MPQLSLGEFRSMSVPTGSTPARRSPGDVRVVLSQSPLASDHRKEFSFMNEHRILLLGCSSGCSEQLFCTRHCTEDEYVKCQLANQETTVAT